jgi:hypothetical protein
MVALMGLMMAVMLGAMVWSVVSGRIRRRGSRVPFGGRTDRRA